jgi:hypothetical protein
LGGCLAARGGELGRVGVTDEVPSVTWAQVLALRLERQHLASRVAPERLVDVVAEMVGIHAQVMSSAELQIAARLDGLRPADIRDALWSHRSLVKSWAMRGTLHLLTAADHALFVASAAAQESWRSEAWQRYFGLTPAEIEAMIAAIGHLLSDRPMTRAELADGVAARLGQPALGEKLRSGWGTYLTPATRRGLLIFGPSEGRNVAFVKPSAWLGATWAPSPLEPLDALAALIERYLVAFPGASRDMIQRWWGGLRAGLINDALRLLGDRVATVDVEGVRGFVRRDDVDALVAAEPFTGVRLLPGFDPFTNELPRRTDGVLPLARHDLVYRTAGWISPIVLVDGRVSGTWEVATGRSGEVRVVPFARWRGAARDELAAEADRVAAFLGRPLVVSVAAAAR